MPLARRSLVEPGLVNINGGTSACLADEGSLCLESRSANLGSSRKSVLLQIHACFSLEQLHETGSAVGGHQTRSHDLLAFDVLDAVEFEVGRGPRSYTAPLNGELADEMSTGAINETAKQLYITGPWVKKLLAAGDDWRKSETVVRGRPLPLVRSTPFDSVKNPSRSQT